jgi:cell wall assembly regulator SMI1
MKFTNSNQQLTLDELKAFEEQFNINLPNDYKKIVLEYNGGYPEKEYFHGAGIYFTPMKYGEYTTETTIELINDILPNGFFPFADYCGVVICLSLEDDDNFGKVYYFYEDGEIEEVAESLDAFMSELSDDPDAY